MDALHDPVGDVCPYPWPHVAVTNQWLWAMDARMSQTVKVIKGRSSEGHRQEWTGQSWVRSHIRGGASDNNWTSCREREVELESQIEIAQSFGQLSWASAREWTSMPRVVAETTGACDRLSGMKFSMPAPKLTSKRDSAKTERCLCCRDDQGSDQRDWAWLSSLWSVVNSYLLPSQSRAEICEPRDTRPGALHWMSYIWVQREKDAC